MKETNREAFVRWQGRALDQMSAVTNLMVALATGLIAVVSPAILDGKLVGGGEDGVLALTSLGSLGLSLVLGLILAWNRLEDFRTTTQIVRTRAEGEGDLGLLRDEARALGKASWRLLVLQGITFGIGVVALVLLLCDRVRQPPADPTSHTLARTGSPSFV